MLTLWYLNLFLIETPPRLRGKRNMIVQSASFFSAQSVSTCKDEFPKFVCHAYWAKFACSNKHSGFIKKCRKSCGYCPEQFGEEADLVQTEQTEQDDEMEYSEKSDSVQKLETLLAHYYLKLER